MFFFAGWLLARLPDDIDIITLRLFSFACRYISLSPMMSRFRYASSHLRRLLFLRRRQLSPFSFIGIFFHLADRLSRVLIY